MYLSIGKLIAQTGSLPSQDPFMYTYQDWHIQHEWLSYLIFYGLFLFAGFVAVTLLKVVLWNGIFLQVTSPAKSLKGKESLVFLFLLLLMLACAHRFVERASLFSDLFLTIIFASLLQGRITTRSMMVATPILFLFWVNLHPAFIFGLLLIGIYSVLNLRDKKVWIVFGLSVLACLFNPLFIEGFIYPIATVFKADWAIYKLLNYEWMPTFGPLFIKTANVKALIVIIALSLLVTLFKLSTDSKAVFKVISILVFGYITSSASRFIPIGAIAFTLLAFDSLQNYRFQISPKVNQFSVRILTLACVSLAVHFYFSGYTPASGPRHFGFGIDSQAFPVQATAQLKQLPEGRIFNEYEWGSYLAWELGPTSRIFIHGHIDDPKILAVDYNNMNRSQELFDQTVQRFDIRYILLDKTKLVNPMQPIVGFMSKWQVAYQDSFSILLAKP